MAAVCCASTQVARDRQAALRHPDAFLAPLAGDGRGTDGRRRLRRGRGRRWRRRRRRRGGAAARCAAPARRRLSTSFFVTRPPRPSARDLRQVDGVLGGHASAPSGVARWASCPASTVRAPAGAAAAARRRRLVTRQPAGGRAVRSRASTSPTLTSSPSWRVDLDAARRRARRRPRGRSSRSRARRAVRRPTTGSPAFFSQRATRASTTDSPSCGTTICADTMTLTRRVRARDSPSGDAASAQCSAIRLLRPRLPWASRAPVNACSTSARWLTACHAAEPSDGLALRGRPT